MISPTAYKLHAACQRAWWYRYVAGLRTPPTAALANGSAVHAAVETYLTTGAWPESDAPAVAQAYRAQDAIDAWAGKVVGGWRVEVEAASDLAPRGGVDRLGGRVDWSGDEHSTTGGPWIIDHKTTASPSYWLTPEQLATDSQLLAYAGALFPTAESVTVGHLYIPPAPTEPALVVATATREEIDATLARYAAATVSMAALRTLDDPEAAPASTAACWAYGGCAYADRCTAAPEALRRRTTRTEEGTTMSSNTISGAQAALRARLGLGGGGTPPMAPTEPTKPTPATEGAVSAAVATRPSPNQATEGTATIPPAAIGAEEEDDGLTELGRRALVGASAPPSVVPPDAPKRTRAPRKSVAVDPRTTRIAVDNVTGAALAGAQRVTGNPASGYAVEVVPEDGSPVVYVGCASSRGGTTLEEWVPDILDGATRDEKGTDVGHYLLVPFGGGPRLVAAEVAKRLRAGTLTLPRRLVVPADHPCAAVLVPTLARYAEIVRGVGR